VYDVMRVTELQVRAFWSAVRIHPFQLTAQIGFAKEGGNLESREIISNRFAV